MTKFLTFSVDIISSSDKNKFKYCTAKKFIALEEIINNIIYKFNIYKSYV